MTKSTKNKKARIAIALLRRSYKYTKPNSKYNIEGYEEDKKLSGKRTQVYYNDKDKKQIIVHRGTQGIQDIFTDVNLALGRLTKTARYKHSKKIAEEARKSRPDYQTTQLGHSLGGALARRVAKKNDKLVTYNTAVELQDLFKKQSNNQSNYRTAFDPVSILAPLALPNIHTLAGGSHSLPKANKFEGSTQATIYR